VNNGAFQYLPPKGTTDFGAANADNGYPSMENMTTDATANFTYDGNQNMTFDGVNTLTYDVENRLVEAQNAAWGTSTYLYDPLGRRKQKQVVDGAYTVTTQFVLAGGQEIADYNGTGVGTAWVLTVRGAGVDGARRGWAAGGVHYAVGERLGHRGGLLSSRCYGQYGGGERNPSWE
jgi:YD repeat-containing protein